MSNRPVPIVNVLMTSSRRLAPAVFVLLLLGGTIAPAAAARPDLDPPPETAPPAPRVAAEAPAPGVLQDVLDRLQEMVPSFTTRSVLAVSVIRLDTLEKADYNGSEPVKAASAVKAMWMAAALEHSGIGPASQYAERALWASSNLSGGRLLDLAGGIDAANDYLHDRGLTGTTTYEWDFGRRRRSSLYPGPQRGTNLTTTDDLARFWQMVAYGQALGWPETASLLEWTRGIKEDSDGNRLVARLPLEIAEESSWKMGWLPVGRPYVLGPGEVWPGGLGEGDTIYFYEGSVIIGGGIIRLPAEKGPSYAIGIAAYEGRSWRGMTSWVEYVSCVVYSVMAGDPAPCSRPADLWDLSNHLAPPDGELASARMTAGVLHLDGWAGDPDAWWQPVSVRITLDGQAVGYVTTAPQKAGELLQPPLRGRLELASLHYEKMGIAVEGSTHEVCAVALNDGFGDHTPIGCLPVEFH